MNYYLATTTIAKAGSPVHTRTNIIVSEKEDALVVLKEYGKQQNIRFSETRHLVPNHFNIALGKGIIVHGDEQQVIILDVYKETPVHI